MVLAVTQFITSKNESITITETQHAQIELIKNLTRDKKAFQKDLYKQYILASVKNTHKDT